MNPPGSSDKRRTSAILNVAAGLLFLAAGFNLLGRGGKINWLWMLVAVLFLWVGAWGLVR